jgi:transposase
LLHAVLDTKTGKVHGKTSARHTSADFVAFHSEVVLPAKPTKRSTSSLDNLSPHKTKLVKDFLAAYPNVALHFTPNYSSWLNQVEIWFSRIVRDII